MPTLAEPLILGEPSDASLSGGLLGTGHRSWRKPWRWAFVLALLGTAWLSFCIALTVERGIGVWGNNIPVAWAPRPRALSHPICGGIQPRLGALLGLGVAADVAALASDQ